MILDLPRFLEAEHAYWTELEALLNRIDNDRFASLTLPQVVRLQYLYERASSALARLSTFSAEPQTRAYLEALVARAYAECHPNREEQRRFRPWYWLTNSFPQTFRRHVRAFALTVLLTLGGAAFGWTAMLFDNDARTVLLPEFSLEPPAERVKREEGAKTDRLQGHKGSFSAQLMTHNINVALLALALGATWGLGTTLMLFYNGVILGAVCADYVQAGYSQFLMGWLLPHGVVEIPAILVAGQAGFVLASALIGWGENTTRSSRLRQTLPDILTLAGGVAVMLVWAGVVEAFISQYHYPVLPYGYKIAFGLLELCGLTYFFAKAGRA